MEFLEIVMLVLELAAAILNPPLAAQQNSAAAFDGCGFSLNRWVPKQQIPPRASGRMSDRRRHVMISTSACTLVLPDALLPRAR